MASKTFFIAYCVGICLALGDAPKPNMPPRAESKVIDLDFTDDGENWAAESESGHDRKSDGRWIYWTLGAGVVAAGGVGWYIFQDQREPKVTRNEQVFTDER